MVRKYAVLLFLVFASVASAQSFRGEIYLKDRSALYLNQIYITNLRTQQTVLASPVGLFALPAQAGDQIRFTSIISERKDIGVTAGMLLAEKNFIELEVAYNEIKEIVLTKFRATGNLKKDVLALSTKDKVADIQKAIGLPAPTGDGTPPIPPVMGFNGGGLSLSVDAIYDILSGERKKKEKLLQYEKMTAAVNSIKNYYGKSYFAAMKIPESLVDNFLQFVYSSESLQPYISSGNFEAVGFYMEKYLPIYQKRLRNSKLTEIVNPVSK